MARASLWARLKAAEAHAPERFARITLCRRVVSVNPVHGEPPVDEGLAERINTQPTGWPAIIERWDPPLEGAAPPPLTDAETAHFFASLGMTRARLARETVRQSEYIWRNSPHGSVIARPQPGDWPLLLAYTNAEDAATAEDDASVTEFTFTLDGAPQD